MEDMRQDNRQIDGADRFIDSLIARAKQTDNRLGKIRQEIEYRWPEAVCDREQFETQVYRSGIEPFDRLFPTGGIPYGQFIELTGASGSGKTGLVLRLAAGMASHSAKVAYVDFCNCFFPLAAEYGGLEPARVVIVKPDTLGAGLRATELLLKHREVAIAICDLVGVTHELPVTILHRLRRKTIRARGLVIFLTDHTSDIVPASMASLRLEVSRLQPSRVAVRVSKSRICRPGRRIEVPLEDD
ncbi:hypothetical protein GF420_04130 [candidate division GN15 bacterium]|nr:hypothetical protein [candidate division GN15 bacterium]